MGRAADYHLRFISTSSAGGIIFGRSTYIYTKCEGGGGGGCQLAALCTFSNLEHYSVASHILQTFPHVENSCKINQNSCKINPSRMVS